nr:LIC12048 family lipoprotein [Leptospira licerasiae]
MERVACSGVQIEYGDYVIDFSEFAPALGQSKIHLKGIKSFAGVSTTLPCENQTFSGSDGVSRTACVQKPFSAWTDEEKRTAGVWAIYSNGKYNDPTEFWVDGSNIRIFDPGNIQKAQMVKGVDSITWAGDYYDIVYISVKDLAKNEVNPPYGATPIGSSGSTPTGGAIDANDPNSFFKLNTQWDLSQFGENPYEPDQKSFYVGKVGFNEKVVFTVKLDQTKYLNPNFGLPENGGSYQYFTDFKYSPVVATKRFNIDQVMDFEISLGFGGQRTDWVHVYKDTDAVDAYKIQKMWIDTSGYADQTFRICLRMPQLSTVVDPENSLVNIYVRPALNSAYRRTIWPLKYTDVKKMRGVLSSPTSIGDTTIYLSGVYGTIEVNDSIYVSGDTYPYTVVSSTPTPGYPDGSFTVVVDTAMKKKNIKTTGVTIPGALAAPDARLIVDNSFVTDWNTQTNGTPASNYSLPQYLPLLTSATVSCSGANLFHPSGCLGYTPDYLAVNWMGNYNKGVPYWNSWTDAGGFTSFLSGGTFQLTTNSGRTYKAGTLASDTILSDAGTAVPLGEPVSVTQGDVTMVIWRRDTNLYGKVFQISTGTVLGAQFQINTTAITSPGELVAKLDNGKAVIIWENAKDIYLAVRNMSTYAATVAETKVITRNYDLADWSRIDVAAASDRAMVVWSDNQAIAGNMNYHKLTRGRIFNTSTGAVTVDTFLISDVINPDAARYEIQADGAGGTNVLLGLHYRNPVTYAKAIGARVYNITTGVQVGSDISLSDAAIGSGSGVFVKASGTKGFVMWPTYTGPWIARGIDLTTATKLATDLTIDTTNVVADFSLSGGQVFATYSKAGGMYMKVLNLADGQFLYTNALQIGSVSATATQKPGETVLSGNIITSVWEHFENNKRTVRGRTATLSPFALKGSGEFFLSTTNQGTQSGVTLAVYDVKALPAWFSQDTTQQVIRGFSLDLLSPGSLQFGLNNFFIAPLIERDYTLSVQIVP